MKEYLVKIKKIDYRHYICLALTIIFLLFSIFYFKYAIPRIWESCIDLFNSGKFYISKLFELNLHGEITINNFTKLPFVLPWNLPNTWEEFKILMENYWSIFFSKENILNYLSFLSILLYDLSKILLMIFPFIILLIVILNKQHKQNNNYNDDTKSLKWFKINIENKIINPIKNWFYEFKVFLEKNDTYKKLWLLIWIYNFNFIAIFIEVISYYLYFVSSFDLPSLYIQFIKLLMDLSWLLDFFPGFVWFIFTLIIINIIRRNIGYKNLDHMEMKNRGFINERSISTMVNGTMGKGKTTLLVDMALSKEIMFRNKSFEMILECDLEFPNFPWINLENSLKKAIEKHSVWNLATCRRFIHSKMLKWKKKQHKKHIFMYDYEKYGMYFNNELELKYLWETLSDYAQLYFIYIVESSLIISNLSIRTDNILNDLGNFPLWDTELFRRKIYNQNLISRHSHILDFDSLRLGKRLTEDNDIFIEFGVRVVTEIGKERKNNLELNEIKRNDNQANQKNDLTNYAIKMIRHFATIRNFCFVWFGTDEQRPESWGADARELCDLVFIDKKSKFNLCMPLFALEDLCSQIFMDSFTSNYFNYRFNRADNTLPMYLFHNLAAKVNSYQKNIYNTFGFYELSLEIEKGTQDGVVNTSKYYIMPKKIYSKRFSTDCFSEIFAVKAIKCALGINDLQEYNDVKATFEEMEKQNSYFFNDLMKIKNN